MYLVCSWKTGLDAIWNTTWLSHMSFVLWRSPNLYSKSKFLSHASSFELVSISWYSTSALDNATLFYFLLLHGIILPPIRKQYLNMDLLSDGDPTQFASTKQMIFASPLSSYNSHFPGVFFIYLIIRTTTF